MDVKVETKCGRCGRTEEKSMALEAAGKMEQESTLRAEAAANLKDAFNEKFGSSGYPDIVVAVRNSGGDYTVNTLDGLCSREGAARNRGCKTRVANLIDEIFTVAAPKKRAAPKKEPPAEPPKKNPPKGKGK